MTLTQKLSIAVGAAALFGVAVFAAGQLKTGLAPAKAQEPAKPITSGPPQFTPTAVEWASLTIETVTERVFRAEHVTEGKIAVNEDTSTPVFSPYAGRVTRLLAKPGDVVKRGQPLMILETTDTVQALNDFVAALGTLDTARSKFDLAQIVEKRATDLYAGKAVPLKDLQQAQADLNAAQNDLRSAETGLEAAHNRLHILGRSEDEIAAFQRTRQVSADTPIQAPISGTIVQRKVGPGQFINSGATDPVFVIGDLSAVWLAAFVRETEAGDIAVGQDARFRVLALPDRELSAQISYVSAAIDPATRRLLVRATIDNKDGLLKPEMFASVTIYAAGNHPAPAVPKQAIVYEGDRVHIWVARDEKTIELRQVTIGLTNSDLVEVLSNLNPGEKVVTRGSLFIDRAASSI